ncbi:MAG: hypothetical protein M3Z04_13325 [Chloroflexota bacterium]|nr:hypothetical protein [Chloroflexota bacterium]
MTVPPTAKMFHSFVANVEAVLTQANVPIANRHNFYTPGTLAYVGTGWGHEVPNRLSAIVYRTKLADPEQGWDRDAPPEYKAILERAGFVVEPSRMPGGWAVWAVYPPPDATEP